ncbi:MAG: hypothetical protein P8X55_01460 [Desulfosarcinaceae bacterium]
MNILRTQHCFNHYQREAVVRCPGCGRYYCRECVTEHDERMLCSHCLEQKAASGGHGRRRLFESGLLLLQGLGGWLILGYAFYLLGKTLLAIPHDFHEGTLWKGNWWSRP